MRIGTTDPATMTPEAILAENQDLMTIKAAIRERQLALNAALTTHAADARAAEVLAGLSDAEKASLAQQIAPLGVASSEAAGILGA